MYDSYSIFAKKSVTNFLKNTHQKIGTEVYNFFFEDIEKNGFDQRDGQADMACEIVDAVASRKHMVVEAGVGIGKSYAYIVPLLYFHKENNTKPMLIATSTITLQTQLQSDIEDMMKILKYRTEVILAKGMNHFLCHYRFDSFFADDRNEKKYSSVFTTIFNTGRFTGYERSQWELNIPEKVWKQINVSEFNSKLCHEVCKGSSTCYYYRLRQKMKNTKGIIVCNQDLLTANLRKRKNLHAEILSSDIGIVVIDEAHNLEDKVRSSFTDTLIHSEYIKAVNDCIRNIAIGVDLDKQITDIDNMLHDLFADIQLQIDKQIIDAQKEKSGIERFFFERNLEKIKAIFSLSNEITFEMSINTVDRYGQNVRLHNAIERLETMNEFLKSMSIEPSKDIFWLERWGKTQDKILIYKCPKNVNEAVSNLFFNDANFTTILTSATLTNSNVDNNMDNYSYFINNTNFPLAKGVLSDPKESPFPYDKNAMIYYTENLPHPSKNRQAFIDDGVGELVKLLEISNGKALILFTAKTDMDDVYAQLSKLNLPYNIIKQNEKSSQSEMIDNFKQDVNSVLLGTGVFWEGINIEGISLSHLIIFKLPFPVPEPIVKYKCDNSENALMDVLVPEMIIKLKQGIGRLIRSKDDKGIVSIIDSRVGDSANSKYKSIVWNSLPIKNKTNDINNLRSFYNRLHYAESA